MRCLTDSLSDKELTGRLADDYSAHKEQDIYISYLEQVTTDSNKEKGDKTMVCEGLFRLNKDALKNLFLLTRNPAEKGIDQHICL